MNLDALARKLGQCAGSLPGSFTLPTGAVAEGLIARLPAVVSAATALLDAGWSPHAAVTAMLPGLQLLAAVARRRPLMLLFKAAIFPGLLA